MKAVGESNDVRATCGLARNFDRRFDRIRASRAHKHQFVIHRTRLQDMGFKSFDKRAFGTCVHVQTMGDAVIHDVVDQRGLHVRIVVAVIQG